MIRPLVESDFNAAIQIVNRNWKMFMLDMSTKACLMMLGARSAASS